MNRLLTLRWDMPWPLPALCAWALSWGLFLALRARGGPMALALALTLGTACAAVLAWTVTDRPWRRLFIGAGFPLSVLLSDLALDIPPAAWLLPLLLLASIYPLQAWRDAPMFPTPAGALQGLAEATLLPAGARMLDAGCGLGHGMQALRGACPLAEIHGIERSWPLRLLAAWRCPWAGVQQGDMWRLGWQGYDLVYLFQRPESMARALAKAQQQMAPGSWLVSLEFAVPGRTPDAALRAIGGKPVWLYRVGRPGAGPSSAQPQPAAADKTPGRRPIRAGAIDIAQ